MKNTGYYSFRRAYESLPHGKVNQVRQELMEVLGVGTVGLYRRIRGEIEPRISEAKAIEKVFQKYGIKKVWDCE